MFAENAICRELYCAIINYRLKQIDDTGDERNMIENAEDFLDILDGRAGHASHSEMEVPCS